MLGHIVSYNTSFDDNGLLETAKTEQMVLLTSDVELYNRALGRGITCMIIRGLNEEERLADVARTFNLSLDLDMNETRCPECGSELREAEKLELSGLVPEKSLAIYDRFWKCTGQNCEKVYWRGSHWRQIHKMLVRAKQFADTN